MGIGMIFLPRHDQDAQTQGAKSLKAYYSNTVFRSSDGVQSLRDLSALGAKALETLPEIQQVLVGRPEQLTDDAFEQRLYLICKELEHRVAATELDEFHIASFSHRTIVYKGLLVAPQLDHFYPDLRDPDFQAALAVFHQRYSTNTRLHGCLRNRFIRLHTTVKSTP